MASRAVESYKLSNLHLAKYKYFVFNLFIFKSQILYLTSFVNGSELSIYQLNALFAIYSVTQRLLFIIAYKFKEKGYQYLVAFL
tara:strand:- start:488 stop:739 length:252 start_codon:yes stop_codon:yes gene_type:complete